MSGGQWYNDHTWLPTGCATRGYGGRSIKDCAHGRKLVLIGDYSIQGLFWALATKLDGTVRKQGMVESDLDLPNDQVKLHYHWDPYLNGSALFRYAQAYRNGEDDVPMIMVVGGGRWHAEQQAVEGFVDAVQRIADAAPPANGRISGGSAAYSRKEGPGDMLVFAPVQEPYADAASAERDLYQAMNAGLKTRADQRGLDVLWSFAEMTNGQRDKYADDLLYASEETERQKADILMSLRCNAQSSSRGFFPNTRTCCATWRGPNWIQFSFLLMGLAILPMLVLLDYQWAFLTLDGRTIIRAFSAFASAVSLQYVADRTHVFEQVTRLPLEPPNLRNMIIAIVIIGFISIRRSKPPKKLTNSTKQPDQPFLPRDQSDEWKGWMQFLIITYHYNMAWTNTMFWAVIRLAVASYLFLTGFGHTVYFLQKRDYSFRRVAAVMIRTNLLPVALAYVMRTRWLMYYYMPLSTFWFLAVYATLAIAPSWNERTILLVGKIFASAATIQALLRTKDLIETIVRVFAIACKISFDTQKFFQVRVKNDAYIVYVGMLAAIFYLWTRDVLGSDRRQDALSKFFRRAFPWLKLATVGISLAAFVGFWFIAHQRLNSQPKWQDFQPYITFIPILTFTVMRNAHPVLRNFHSAAFAWLGRYSGEMYVMQDHLWLAGDQEAVLRTGFFHGDETLSHDRWRDLMLITPLYLIACCIIGDSTGTIATWFCAESDSSGKTAGRPPQDEVEMGLLENAEGTDDDNLQEKVAPPERMWSKIQSAVWPDKVRDRAILLLLCLWFLNVVSRQNGIRGITAANPVHRCTLERDPYPHIEDICEK